MVEFSIPEVTATLDRLMSLKSTFDGKTQSIGQWVEETRSEIAKNRFLISLASAENDIAILNIFLRDLLVRAIKGEMGERVAEQLQTTIQHKSDLTIENYRKVLERAHYRWGVDTGSQVIADVVKHFELVLKWDWQSYVRLAEEERGTNFRSDPLLRIKNISFKLRDLALSKFSPHFAAFDLHVTRVPTRLGWLNLGFPLLVDPNLEMGNNPGNHRNYLFLHALFVQLSEMTGGKFTPVDIDRVMWHVGKSVCGARSKCGECPVAKTCPTGSSRA